MSWVLAFPFDLQFTIEYLTFLHEIPLSHFHLANRTHMKEPLGEKKEKKNENIYNYVLQILSIWRPDMDNF